MATDFMEINCSFAHDGEGRLVYEEWSVWVVGTESGLDVVEMSGYGAAAAYVRAWCGRKRWGSCVWVEGGRP